MRRHMIGSGQLQAALHAFGNLHAEIGRAVDCVTKGLRQNHSVAPHCIAPFGHIHRVTIPVRRPRFACRFAVQPRNRRIRPAREPCRFQQALAVHHLPVLRLPQIAFQRRHFLPCGRLQQMFAPIAPTHNMDAAHKGMQPRNIGKTGFANPIQFHVGPVPRQIAHGRQRVNQIAHTGQTHQ